MSLSFFPICHGASGHHVALWPLMVGGMTVGCILHCAGMCALCLSGGTALSVAFMKSFRVIVSHLAPALMIFGSSVVFLRQELMFNV